MKSFEFGKKLKNGRTVYALAGVSFCLVAIAIAIVYSQTVKTLEKSLSPLSTTSQVNMNKQDEPDPRLTTRVISTKKETTALPPTTEITTTTNATEIESTAVSVSASQSFMMPHDGEIIKKYSPDIPVYCETMNDWRTHQGIDIAVKEGDEALSAGNGKVSKVYIDSSYGYVIEVDYGTFTGRYCGMKQGACAGINDILAKGDSVGVIDTVPCESKAAPHLHFEVLVEGKNENPGKVIRAE